MNIALIASGGKGTRFNNTLPKQYCKVNGKEIIAYTLDTFQKCEQIDQIYIAAQTEYFELIYSLKEKYRFTKIINVIEGGGKRQDSVYNALKSITASDDDLIAVHDAARPFIQPSIIKEALFNAEKFDNTIVCIKAKDTLLKGDDFVLSHIDRDGMYYVQTPQVFRYKILKEAMNKAFSENYYGTDESMLVLRAGYKIKITEGSLLNFKITTPDDLILFEKLVGRGN